MSVTGTGIGDHWLELAVCAAICVVMLPLVAAMGRRLEQQIHRAGFFGIWERHRGERPVRVELGVDDGRRRSFHSCRRVRHSGGLFRSCLR